MNKTGNAGTTGATWVYSFGATGTDGDSSMRNLLGGKGANLAEMSGIGLPVPPGFTITTEVCTYFYDNGKQYPAELEAEVKAAEAAEKSRRDTGAPVEKEAPATIFDYYKPPVLEPVYVGGYYKRANPWDKGKRSDDGAL